MTRRLGAALAFPLALAPAVLLAQDPPEWIRPTAPFHVAGPIWYVGSAGLAAYLIKTRDGAILIDGTMAENAPAIRRNIAAVGVPIRRVKLILLSHAHFDHAAGIAALKAASGARLVTGAGDAAAMATGIPPGETSYGVIEFPAAKVDRAVRDGDRIEQGGVTLTTVSTPGHTPGCTSYALRTQVAGRPRDVLFLCSLTVAGNKLSGNRRYPGIVADFRTSFERMAQRRFDIVLPFHPEQADVLARGHRGGEQAFIDPELLPRLVAEARAAFEREYRKQTAIAR